MKLDLVKKSFAKEGFILAGIIFALSAGFALSYGYVHSLEGDFKKAEKQKMRAIRVSLDKKREYQMIVDSFELYQSIPENKLPSKGALDSTVSRIREARPLIESLKQKYGFTDVNVTFSNINPNKKTSQQQNINIIRNDIAIEASALTDEMFLSFVKELIDRLPGYPVIKSLQLRKVIKDIDEDLLENIKNGRKRHLIKGDVRISWDVLKERGQKK